MMGCYFVNVQCLLNVEMSQFYFLNSKPFVNSFGIRRSVQFRVFVNKNTKKENFLMLRTQLSKISPEFFKHYILQIKERQFVEENLTRSKSLKQGSLLIRNMEDDTQPPRCGTLGGIVYQTENQNKKYALTCHHLFPKKNSPVYMKDSQNIREIGKRVFTTKTYTDFAAIKIKKSLSNSCDVTFRRKDKKKTKAFVYSDCINSVCTVYKNGIASNITPGKIEYSEFFINKYISWEKREISFLVRNKGKSFATNGDSGSLVFFHPVETEENYVNVIGMLCSNIKWKGKEEEEKEKEEEGGGNLS